MLIGAAAAVTTGTSQSRPRRMCQQQVLLLLMLLLQVLLKQARHRRVEVVVLKGRRGWGMCCSGRAAEARCAADLAGARLLAAAQREAEQGGWGWGTSGGAGSRGGPDVAAPNALACACCQQRCTTATAAGSLAGSSHCSPSPGGSRRNTGCSSWLRHAAAGNGGCSALASAAGAAAGRYGGHSGCAWPACTCASRGGRCLLRHLLLLVLLLHGLLRPLPCRSGASHEQLQQGHGRCLGSAAGRATCAAGAIAGLLGSCARLGVRWSACLRQQHRGDGTRRRRSSASSQVCHGCALLHSCPRRRGLLRAHCRQCCGTCCSSSPCLDLAGPCEGSRRWRGAAAAAAVTCCTCCSCRGHSCVGLVAARMLPCRR